MFPSTHAFHLSRIIQAETLDAAWNGVVGLSRELGFTAVVKTRYRRTRHGSGEGGVRLELTRLHLDGALSPRRPAPAIPGRLAPSAGDKIAPPRDGNGLPVAVSGGGEGSDPFAERLAGILQDQYGLPFHAILTVPGMPVAADIVAEFVSFLAAKALAPDVASLLGSAAGAYWGRVAVLASRQDGRRGVSLRPQEIECIRWAVAGKSIQDIADITGLSYRRVRYQIDRARERYGYVSNLQTFVRASVDYGLDPLTCPLPKGHA